MSGETAGASQGEPVGDASASSKGEDATESNVVTGDGSDAAAIPAAGVINQTMPLEVVAQQESTRSYFLAQTLESTKTVPIVSANLPLDKGTTDEVAEPETPAEGDASSEDEGGDDSDESDPGASDGIATAPGVSAESTVVGSFEYRGITYAVEPGGESVAVVAADYAKLPEEFVDAQTIVLPSMVTSDGLDFYSVSRIADHAFAGINEVVAVAAQNGQDADAPSSMQAQAEACAYGDDATAEPSGDDDVADDADPKSSESSDVADDAASSTPEDASIGITAVTVPASVVEIGDDAFTGCDTLQYVIVSEDNPAYSQYDGCLYDADRTCLLLIPEGRLGAVWVAPSVVTLDPAAFSHCAVDTVIADPDSAAFQLLSENGEAYKNKDNVRVISITSVEADKQGLSGYQIDHEAIADLETAWSVSESGNDSSVIDSRQAYAAWSYTRVKPSILHAAPNSRDWWWYYGGTGLDGAAGVSNLRGGSWGSSPIAFNSSGIYKVTDRYLSFYHSGIVFNNLQLHDPSQWHRVTYGKSARAIRLACSGPYGRDSSHTYRMETSSTATMPNYNTEDIHYWLDAYVNVMWSPLSGSWTEGETTYSSSNPKYVESSLEAFGNTTSFSFDHPTTSISADSTKVFYGWNTWSNATPTSTNGWWYKADGSINNASTIEPRTFYAVYQDGFRLTWDVERFGSEQASVSEMTPASSTNTSVVASGSTKNQRESIFITDTANRSGVVQVPVASHPQDASNGVHFLGWTNQESGAKPVDDEGNVHDYLQPGERFIVSETKLVNESDPSDVLVLDGKRGDTWYAVWTTEVRFSAPSYGGEIIANADGITGEMTVLNNQPVTPDTILVNGEVPVDDASKTGALPNVVTDPDSGEPGDFVPEQFGKDGYEADAWTFKGWTATTNPNVSEAGEIGGDTAHLPDSDVAAAPVPDGATTFHAVWECEVSWKKADDSPDGTAFADTPATASYLYGYNVTAPAITGVPTGWHFSHWEDSAAPANSSDKQEDGSHIYTVRTGGPVTAYWAPNTRAVVLNGNDTDAADSATSLAQSTYAVYGEGMELFAANADGSGLDTAKPLAVPKREGYTFAGYWNTRYTETPGATETVPLTSTNADGTSKTATVQAKQYYGVNDPANPTALVSTADWDVTDDDQQLFAHWRYTVRLNMNTINSDGEYVLNSASTDFAANIVWPGTPEGADPTFSTEQTDYARGPRYFPTGTIKVENSTATSASLITYTFTAIDGAPIQLPQVTNRKGYGTTAKWGTAPGSNGEAAGTIYTGVTAPFRTVLSNVTTVNADGLSPQAGHAFCLYASWGGDDDTSGKPVSHNVTIVSQYGDFEVNEAAMREVGPVAVTYDKDIDLTGTPLAAAIPTDASTDANGNPRNLRLVGYYVGESSIGAASSGRQYLKMNDEGTLLVSANKFREDEDITIYAWWTYDTMTITFDAQGGTSTKGADFTKTLTGVTANDAVAERLSAYGSLDASFDTAPKREGYVFAGWWNTRYTENASDGQTEVLPSGKTVTPRCYYMAAPGDEGERAVSRAADADKWLEFGATTLYAHWKYDISFNTNCAPDIADVSLSTVSRSTNDATHINADVLLVPSGAAAANVGGAARDGALADRFGNEYTETTSTDGAAVTVVSAIAGAPVLIPEAQERREKVGNAWERVGYNNTRVWTTGEGNAKTTIQLDGTDTAYYRTRTTDSWSDDGLPVKLGGWIGGMQATQTLTADWTDKEMEFYVQVDYDYPTTVGAAQYSYDSTHASPSMMLRVRYDQNDWRIVTAAGQTGTPVGENGRLAPEHSADLTATATVTRNIDTEEHNNLVFAGIRTEPNPIRSTAERADAGIEYWARSGALTTTSFRGVHGASVDSNSFAMPARFYAVWSEPTTPIAFNLYDASTTDASTVVADAVSLMKGDAVESAAGLSEVKAALAAAITGDARKNYEFAGFWTTPYAETPEANGGVQPTCYYVLDESGSLVAAAPTSDEWLTSANASSTWLEDVPTPLYAHWKFRVSFTNEGVIPGTGTADMLLFGNDDQNGTYAAAKQMVAFPDLAGTYDGSSASSSAAFCTDVRGRVTFGAPLWLPLNQNDNGMNKIRRIRDFDAAPIAYGFAGQGYGETGYAFAGWQVNDGEAGTVLDASAIDPAADVLLDPTVVVPGADGTAHLIAAWDAIEFTITLDAWPEMYASFLTSDASLSLRDRGTTAVLLAYDDTMRNARPVNGTTTAGYIRVPALYGYTYLGYYGLGSDGVTGGKIDASSGTVSDAGKRFFGQPTPIVSTEDPNAAYADDVFWFVKDFDLSTRTSALHAYYTRDEYAVNFNLRDTADGTLQATTGATPATQWWHYGEKLVADADVTSVDPHRAEGANTVVWPVPGASTFSRHGYTFGGWYYYKPLPEGLSVEDEAAWRTDKRNRVYVYRTDATNMADQKPIPGVFTHDGTSFVAQDVTTWRTALGVPMNGEAGIELYADWTPLEYTVTFVPRFKNNVQHDGVTLTFRYEEVIGPDEAKLVKVASTGAPYDLVGWALLETTAKNDKLNWLFDKSAYDANVKQDSTDVYPRLRFDGLSAESTARFMPSGLAREFTVYGVWDDLPQRNIVLFRGNHGTLANTGGATNVDASGDFATITYDYGVPTYLNTLEADWGVIAAAEDGYRFLGWVEVSPADIAGDTSVTSYAQLTDKSAADAAANARRMTSTVNASDAYQNLVRFPQQFDVKNQSLQYQNPYTSEKLTYRDIYLVAAYQLVDDYRIVLDLGDFATYGDADYASLGARLADDADNPFSWQTSLPNIRYAHQFAAVERDDDDAMKDVEFLLPEPVSDKHVFTGWYTAPSGQGTRIDASTSWVNAGDDRRLWVDAREYAKTVKQGDRETVLYANYVPKTYTVNFESEQGSDADVSLTGLVLGDTFELPYPATRGEGKYFQNWGLKRTSGTALTGQFAAGEQFDLRQLLNAIRTDGSYKDVVMGSVEAGNDTITFRARWDSAISVTMPVQVLVKVDLEREDVLAAAGDLRANYRSEDDENSLKVVSLRYDRLNAAGDHENGTGDGFVFGGDASDTGKVYLGVYVDLQVEDGVEESELFRRENVADDGTLVSGVANQAPPLMIDLSRDAVFAEGYPRVSEGSKAIYEGLYDNAHLDAMAEPDHGLHSHGFRAFGRDGSLPVRYSLLFKNGAKPSDYDLLNGLGAQAAEGEAIPIAHLYYTVALA